ncbi:unnamed protein product [Allacma fusca]|uniref:Calx-beta domain-containing protein n=1 Tax=Allacma fusca TaxID=39272 RepID=A0A8J2PCI8_9HEXA|nr:unnamed protein product [Allacma fusca]
MSSITVNMNSCHGQFFPAREPDDVKRFPGKREQIIMKRKYYLVGVASRLWSIVKVFLLLGLALDLVEGASAEKCEPGLILPVWEPQSDLTMEDRIARGTVYFLAMLYMFVGVSIVSDRFMAAIETITSKEKEIKVKKPNGDTQIVIVRVWNETVANLTLMALGSSAPEILLSIIEIYAKNFEAGDLGPGTIVGSAAFNLLIIIAICMYVIPNGEVRRIKHLRVFFVTAIWSVFAYIWLLLVVQIITPGIIDVWEGVVTFCFFPLTVLTAFIADRKICINKYFRKGFRVNKRGVIVGGEAATPIPIKSDQDHGFRVFEEESNTDVHEFEDSRRQFIRVLREVRKEHRSLDPAQIEELARQQLLTKGPKSRAYYRIQATRKLVGGTNLMKKAQEKVLSDHKMEGDMNEEESARPTNITSIYFEPGHYTVMENVGTFHATIMREGGNLDLKVLVDYETEDGTATGGSDYVPATGTLVFEPGETFKNIKLEVIDDDVFEEDEHFYVRLTNPRYDVNNSSDDTIKSVTVLPELQLVNPFLATVIILDDDHCGVFNLAEKDVEIVESIGTYVIKVVRWSGARGKVAVPYETIDGTAKSGKDYNRAAGELIFENNETQKTISIQINEEDSYEKDILFYLELKDPRLLEDKPGGPLNIAMKNKDTLSKDEIIALEGWPKLGPRGRTQIRIRESKEFKNTVDKLVKRANASLLVGTSSWKEQFIEAVTVSPGDVDDDEDDEYNVPSCGDYIMHFLTIFWKILFAFVPPTDILGGYVSFIVSILAIGLLTAVIGDLASHFGCSVGLKDSVTAIIFVALGTSVPDTFASKVAAVQDEYADASVGNVTGSNAVNVFLGIGIAWTAAAVYHTYLRDLKTCQNSDSYKCGKFNVPPGNLAFSVTLFCSCAVVAIFLLLLRRFERFGGGELGGVSRCKILSSLLLVSLWLFYITMASLEAYQVITAF